VWTSCIWREFIGKRLLLRLLISSNSVDSFSFCFIRSRCLSLDVNVSRDVPKDICVLVRIWAGVGQCKLSMFNGELIYRLMSLSCAPTLPLVIRAQRVLSRKYRRAQRYVCFRYVSRYVSGYFHDFRGSGFWRVIEGTQAVILTAPEKTGREQGQVANPEFRIPVASKENFRLAK